MASASVTGDESADGKHRAFIALGSNMGSRVEMIERACNEMESSADIRIVRTSGLWETKAMYVLDQDSFLNGACEIETTLSPIDLLDRLQAIENKLGRVKVIDKGPRNIDLDIILYDRETILTDRLQVPHKLMLEREFVLRPLSELIPDETLPSLLPQKTISKHLQDLCPISTLSTLTPLITDGPHITALHPNRKTHVMSILNLTPDSFSDGGDNPLADNDLQALREIVLSQISSGATIIDLGGQSTRPFAPFVLASIEAARIIPAIRLIRSLPEAKDISISVDTFHAPVARAAIAAGADIINDVSAGTLDPDMLPTLATLDCSVCLMHMRGTPATMTSMTSYPDGVIPTVAQELLTRLRAAEEAGIRRWRIILDPGLGFAKTQEQNLELLRCLNELRSFEPFAGLPWLVGPSRKGFIGKITGVTEPKKRAFGTATAVVAAVQGGADIVRVHDVKEMTETIQMADAVWRIREGE